MSNLVTSSIRANPKVINVIKSDNKDQKIDFGKILPLPKAYDEFNGRILYISFLNDFLNSLPDYLLNFRANEKQDEKALGELRLNIEKLAKAFIENNHHDPVVLNSLILQTYCELAFGSSNPMEWRNKHWGTKSNAMDVALFQDNSFVMQTQNSFPMAFLMQLSALFPDEEIFVQYSSDDLGRDFGEFTIKNQAITWAINDNMVSFDEAVKWSADFLGIELDDDYLF